MRRKQLGGKLRWEAGLPGREEYRNVLAWMERQLRDTSAKIELGRMATPPDVLARKPETVILATGSDLRPLAGSRGRCIGSRLGRISAECPLRRDSRSVRHGPQRRNLRGGGRLADRYEKLVLLTPRTQIARNVNYCSAIGIHRRLYQADAEIIVAAEPVSFRGGVLTWRNVFTGRVRDIPNVGLFLWSTPRIANDALAEPLRQAGVDTRLVGDCVAPRNLICAIHEGEAAATAI